MTTTSHSYPNDNNLADFYRNDKQLRVWVYGLDLLDGLAGMGQNV